MFIKNTKKLKFFKNKYSITFYYALTFKKKYGRAIQNLHESEQYGYCEKNSESPPQWNLCNLSFEQNDQMFYCESFEDSYDPKKYDHSDQFPDPNSHFQNF